MEPQEKENCLKTYSQYHEQMFVLIWTNWSGCDKVKVDFVAILRADLSLLFWKEETVMEFKLHSEYKPTGDQPQAIDDLINGFKAGNQFQTLLGVTGSGKTFTMANVIAGLNKPTLVIAHNKTLAGQLYGEFKEFFPENAVEYFVSYYSKNKQPQYMV